VAVKKICDTILDAIGNTPMVRINRITRGLVEGTVLAKVETFNPGNSTKDRMAVKMVEDAEKAGLLKPGGTIIEGTSGNTGMGLAIAAVVKGYKCVFTTTDKQSKEKVDALKAFGAEVIVCPTNVDPEDPRSYYSVSSRLEKEDPEQLEGQPVRQPVEHRGPLRADRPEIWEQTDGRVTHLVVGVGTGGTISGVGRYLKERNPDIKVWGIDTYGSVFKKYKETGIFDKNEIYPYITEGIGEDFLPKNVDFSVIDHFEKVTDKDAAVMTRRIAREEGSSRATRAAPRWPACSSSRIASRTDDVIVVIFHDHGSRYVGKMFNDEWMREKGFLEKSGMTEGPRRVGCLGRAVRGRGQPSGRRSRARDEPARLLADFHHARRPRRRLAERGAPVRAVPEGSRGQDESRSRPSCSRHFPFADISTPVELLSTMITPANPAVLVRDFKTDKTFIITRSDIIRVLC
jgi:cystathionine beta-synthase